MELPAATLGSIVNDAVKLVLTEPALSLVCPTPSAPNEKPPPVTIPSVKESFISVKEYVSSL